MTHEPDPILNQPISQFIRTSRATVSDDLEALQQPNTGFRFAQELEDVRNDVEALGVLGIFERGGDVCRRKGQLGREER